jgi:hypothetical protein
LPQRPPRRLKAAGRVAQAVGLVDEELDALAALQDLERREE